MPFLARESQSGSARFGDQSPKYQCPFCNGFDNYFDPTDSLVEMVADFDDFLEALWHTLFTHTRVPHQL